MTCAEPIVDLSLPATDVHWPAPNGAADVRPTKIFIGGISRRTTTKHLRDHFLKYGRVFDCIAMRQPDGRPRGFGYVTLDSADAAARALAESQVIDERIVDTKLAVPDAGGRTEVGNLLSDEPRPFAGVPTGVRPPLSSLWCSAAGQRGGLALPDIGAPFVDSAWPWGEALNCVGLLGSAAPMGRPAAYGGEVPLPGNGLQPAPVDCVDLLTRRRLPETPPAAFGWTQPTGRGAGQLGQPVKAPLGELTNFVDAGGAIQKHGGAKIDKKQPFGFIRSDTPRPIGVFDDTAPKSGGLFSQQLPFSGTKPSRSTLGAICNADKGPMSIYEDAWDAPAEHPSPKIAKASLEAFVATPKDEARLPSAGSAQHFAGECRRCNFFAKGRCRNGQDCSFCHFEHDKRKSSHQDVTQPRTDEEEFSDSASNMSASTPTQPSGKARPCDANVPATYGPPGLCLPKAAPPGLILPSDDQLDVGVSSIAPGEVRPEMCTMGTQTADFVCLRCH